MGANDRIACARQRTAVAPGAELEGVTAAMRSKLQPLVVPAVVAALLLVAGCAPGRAIVRGNWPDGRIEQPVRARAVAVAEPAASPRPEAEEWMAAEPADSDLSAAELNRRGVLQTIYFDYDRSDIRPDQRPVMQANAQWLLEHPGVEIIVEGHCDERGTRQYNLALGAHRAESAADYLIELGIDPSRIETVSYGEELPAVEGRGEDAWAMNRRAEFVIVATGTTD